MRRSITNRFTDIEATLTYIDASYVMNNMVVDNILRLLEGQDIPEMLQKKIRQERDCFLSHAEICHRALEDTKFKLRDVEHKLYLRKYQKGGRFESNRTAKRG